MEALLIPSVSVEAVVIVSMQRFRARGPELVELAPGWGAGSCRSGGEAQRGDRVRAGRARPVAGAAEPAAAAGMRSVPPFFCVRVLSHVFQARNIRSKCCLCQADSPQAKIRCVLMVHGSCTLRLHGWVCVHVRVSAECSLASEFPDTCQCTR